MYCIYVVYLSIALCPFRASVNILYICQRYTSFRWIIQIYNTIITFTIYKHHDKCKSLHLENMLLPLEIVFFICLVEQNRTFIHVWLIWTHVCNTCVSCLNILQLLKLEWRNPQNPFSISTWSPHFHHVFSIFYHCCLVFLFPTFALHCCFSLSPSNPHSQTVIKHKIIHYKTVWTALEWKAPEHNREGPCANDSSDVHRLLLEWPLVGDSVWNHFVVQEVTNSTQHKPFGGWGPWYPQGAVIIN